MTKFTEIGNVVEGIKFTGRNDKECLDFCPHARDPMDQRGNLILPTLVEEVLVNPGDWIVRNSFGHFRKFTDKELFENYTPLCNEALKGFYTTYVGPLEFVTRSSDIPAVNRSEIKAETKMIPLTLWRPVRGGNSGTDEMNQDKEEGKVVEKKRVSTEDLLASLFHIIKVSKCVGLADAEDMLKWKNICIELHNRIDRKDFTKE